jgi:hypothetical protein
MKVTIPVGVMIRPATVAVNVTVWPTALGFPDEDTAVTLGSKLTTCISTEEVLAAKPLSPA